MRIMFEIIEKVAGPVLMVAINLFIRKFFQRHTLSSKSSSAGIWTNIRINIKRRSVRLTPV